MQHDREGDLAAALRRFEQDVDKSNPEQMELLRQMQEHTRRLQQVRGEWSRLTTDRLWNSAVPPEKALPPTATESYRAYKEHMKKQEQQQQLLTQPQASQPPRLLTAPAAQSGEGV